jgi:molybdopterin synthase sulfur carrier subunit
MKKSNLKKKKSRTIHSFEKTIINMATVIIPTPLRKFTKNEARLQVKSTDIQGTVQELTLNFPELKKHLLDERGQIRSFVNIFVGNEDIRNLQQGNTLVEENSIISIIPAIAGG